MYEKGKIEIVNPNGDTITHVDTRRKAEKIVRILSNAFSGEYYWRYAA